MRTVDTPTTTASTTEGSPPTPTVKSSRGVKRKSIVSNKSASERSTHEPVSGIPEMLGVVRLRSLHSRVLSWHVDSGLLGSVRLNSDEGSRKWRRMLTMMRRDAGSRSDPDHRVVVIFDANVTTSTATRVSGFMWFSSNSPCEIIIRDTWVDPQRRRLGIGSRMVRIFAMNMISSSMGDHSSDSSISSTSTRASSSGDDFGEYLPTVDFHPNNFRVLALPAPASTTFWESNFFSGEGQSGGFLQLTWEAMMRLAQRGMDSPVLNPSRKAARITPARASK